jgi:hypothetical protein
MVAFFDIDQWATDAASHVDVMAGFRLHGNVIALHQGIPAIFFTYDTRIRELGSLFAVPSIEVEEYLPVNLEAILERADFSKLEHIYRVNYAEYHRFLTENRLNHVLAKPVAPPSDKPLSTPNLIQVQSGADDLIAWFRSEINFMTSEIETLRDRAWNLETKLRNVTGKAAQELPARAAM